MCTTYTAQQILDSEWPFEFADSDDWSCPCCEIHGENFEIEVHCWRVPCEFGCKYAGIHVSGELDKETKLKLAEHIRDNNGWTKCCDWNLEIL